MKGEGIMDNKKVQVEIALKDNLSKQLDSLSSKVKKVAQDMQNSVRSMQNSFNNVKINTTGIDSSISSIKKKLQSLGNEEVKIDATVDVDASAVEGLNNGIDIVDLTTMASIGNVGSTMSNVSSTMQQMSTSIRNSMQGAIQDTESYQAKIKQVTNVWEELNTKMGQTPPSGFENYTPVLDDIKKEIISLIAFFEEFKDEVGSANNALSSLNSMQDSIKSRSAFTDNKSKIQNEIEDFRGKYCTLILFKQTNFTF